jgi:hypothetical protein
MTRATCHTGRAASLSAAASAPMKCGILPCAPGGCTWRSRSSAAQMRSRTACLAVSLCVDTESPSGCCLLAEQTVTSGTVNLSAVTGVMPRSTAVPLERDWRTSPIPRYELSTGMLTQRGRLATMPTPMSMPL